MNTIRIGSRESKLAVIQSELVQDYLRAQGLDVQIVTMKTTGDMILDRTLDQIGGKGLFVKELDRALLDGRSDLSVHSLKVFRWRWHRNFRWWPILREKTPGMC